MIIQDRAARFWRPLCVVVGAVLLSFGSSSYGDVLVTGDGESLSGTLTRVVDGILVFQTSLHGQMMLPMGEARSLRTKERWIVNTNDGDIHVGRFVLGGIALDGPEGERHRVVSVPFEDIDSATLAPPQPKKDGVDWPPEESPWKQEVVVGVRSHLGSRDSVAPFVQWDAEREMGEKTLGLRLYVDIPQTDSVGDTLRADFEFLSRDSVPWVPFFKVSLGRDTDDALAWRTGLTVGVRHDFSTRDNTEFSTYLGLAGFYSRWRGYAGKPYGMRLRESEESVALRVPLGVSYTQRAWREGRWDNQLTVFPGFSSVSSFRAEAETALTYPLTSRLRLRFDMRVAYENEPVFDTLKSVNAHLGASLGFDF